MASNTRKTDMQIKQVKTQKFLADRGIVVGQPIRIERTKGVIAMSDVEFMAALADADAFIQIDLDELSKPGAWLVVEPAPPLPA